MSTILTHTQPIELTEREWWTIPADETEYSCNDAYALAAPETGRVKYHCEMKTLKVTDWKAVVPLAETEGY